MTTNIQRCTNAEHPTRCCYVQRYHESGLPFAESLCPHFPSRAGAEQYQRERQDLSAE